MVMAVYVKEIPAFTIEDGVVQMRVVSNGEDMVLHFPLCRFRTGHQRVKAMLAQHDHGDTNVRPFPTRKS